MGLSYFMHSRTDIIGNTADCEVKLEGEGVWSPAPDIEIIHTPVSLLQPLTLVRSNLMIETIQTK
jgi:hypothetical protein